MRLSLIGTVAIVLLGAILATGCGSSDDGETKTAATTENEAASGGGSAGGGQQLTIKMGDYFFAPANGSAKAGRTVIEAPNEGAVEHELVVFKTKLDPAKLPTDTSGGVDEEKLDEVAEGAGEVPDVEAGETKSGDFELTPGKYVIFCNLPGHYAQGMYGTLTVTK